MILDVDGVLKLNWNMNIELNEYDKSIKVTLYYENRYFGWSVAKEQQIPYESLNKGNTSIIKLNSSDGDTSVSFDLQKIN